MAIDAFANSTTEEDVRFAACWRNQNCDSCIHNRHGCGWCPYTGLCIPAASIFEPVTNEDICPHWSERWELRMKPLGCGCSTTTLLSIIVTILATIVGLVLLFGMAKLLKRLNAVFGTGSFGGWEMEFKKDGTRGMERRWRRGGVWKNRFVEVGRRWNPALESEQDVRTERSRLLG